MTKSKKHINNKINGTSIMTTLIFILVLSVMTVGFALSPYTKILDINGDLSLIGNGTVYISNILLSDSSNVQSSNPPTFDGEEASFHITFRGRNGNAQRYYATYQIDITNDSYYDYTYTGFDYNPVVSTTQGNATAEVSLSTSGLQPGDTISPHTTEVLNVTITLTVVSGNANNSIFVTELTSTVQTEAVEHGEMTAVLNNNTGDLSGDNTRAQFTVSVINTFTYDRQFELRIGDNNFKLVDANGNNLGPLTIPANGNETYTFYIEDVEGAAFLTTEQTTSLMLISNGINPVSLGNVTLTVDLNIVEDNDPPTVGNATLTQSNTEGSAIASWDRIDSGGTAVTSYTVTLYNSSGGVVSTQNTGSDATTYTFTGLNEDTAYYFAVYGEDASGNSGASSLSSATTSNGYATRSSNTTMDWRVTVNTNLTRITLNGENTALRGQNYTATLTANTTYNLPNSITVTMGGQTLTSGTDYTYSANNGSLTIYNVSGNINISGTATGGICLIEGTKILLADGTYKNIEDINYYDLLLVHDYTTGELIEEYPIWIEQEHKTNKYQLTTFSDGSTLKTVGFHGVFSYDKNEFISVDNKKDFKVGTTIAKYNPSTKKMEPVKVSKIEFIKEDVTYHHVVSTRFYNIISDNILTTDGTVILSNLYGFNKNITWTDVSKMVQSNNDYLYTYEDLNVLPYYMFKGLRAKEGKWLSQFGLDLETFRGYLFMNQVNPDMLLPYPKDSKGNYLFPVGTNESNTKYLSNNSIYIVPSPKYPLLFKYYVNTTDGSIYYPGDRLVVDTPTYLKAIY